jgi:serine/threonine protein kinase
MCTMTMMNATSTAIRPQPQQPELDPRIRLFLKRHFTVQWQQEADVPADKKAQVKFEKLAMKRRLTNPAADVFWQTCNLEYHLLRQDIAKGTDCSHAWNTWNSIKSLTSMVHSKNGQHVFLAHDFVLLDKVGEGGYASVYRAVHVPTGHIVALKQIDIASSCVETHDHQLLSINCGVVPCYGTFLATAANQQDPLANNAELKTWMILKLCKNGSLKDKILSQGALSQHEAAHILKKVAKTVTYLYEKHGIVHHDIKPANVLFDDDGSILLCDLGVAKKGKWQTERIGGTYSHMSPEKVSARKLAAGKYYSDQKMDVFAMGVMLCEMLFKSQPFRTAPLAECPTIASDLTEDGSKILHDLTEQCYHTIKLPSTKKGSFDEAKDLLGVMLAVDSERRMSLADITKHPFITRHGKWSDRAILHLKASLGLNAIKPKSFTSATKPKHVTESPEHAKSTAATEHNSSKRFGFDDHEADVVVDYC